jgi:hypothetical protein
MWDIRERRKKLMMDRGKPDATPGNWLSPDVLRAFDALLATAIGTLAGILVDSGFGLRVSIVNVVYRLLEPVFDVFSAYPNGQLALAGFVYRIPIVLIVGLLAGLFLRHFRYPRLLLCSVPVWMAYLVGRKLVFALPLLVGGNGGNASSSFQQLNIVPELVLYSMQYALLVLVIYATDALTRSARRKSSATV